MHDLKILLLCCLLSIILFIYKVFFEKAPEVKKENRIYINQKGKLVTLAKIKIKE